MPIIHSYPQTPNSDPSFPSPYPYLILTLTPQFYPGAAQTHPSLLPVLRLRLLHGSLGCETRLQGEARSRGCLA